MNFPGKISTNKNYESTEYAASDTAVVLEFQFVYVNAALTSTKYISDYIVYLLFMYSITEKIY